MSNYRSRTVMRTAFMCFLSFSRERLPGATIGSPAFAKSPVKPERALSGAAAIYARCFKCALYRLIQALLLSVRTAILFGW